MDKRYADRLPIIREIAKKHGYAVGVHGSQKRDLDFKKENNMNKWNYLSDNKFPEKYGKEDYSKLLWVQIYEEVSPKAEKELFTFWRPVVYWEVCGDKGFCYENTEEEIKNVVAWQYLFMPNPDPTPKWCRVCSDFAFGEHECGEWFRPDECECEPYHSNESGTIEEKICESCKDKYKSDEIPF